MLNRWMAYQLLLVMLKQSGLPINTTKLAKDAAEMVKVMNQALKCRQSSPEGEPPPTDRKRC